MELKKVLLGIEGIKARGNLDLDIVGIEKNSKEVKKGYMFIAIKGFSVDGHQFVENAIENGAIAEKGIGERNSYKQWIINIMPQYCCVENMVNTRKNIFDA